MTQLLEELDPIAGRLADSAGMVLVVDRPGPGATHAGPRRRRGSGVDRVRGRRGQPLAGYTTVPRP